jgi:hypothetical protein
MQIPDADALETSSPGEWLVCSQSKKGVKHVVSVSGAWATCSCPMGLQMERTCIHILKVAELQGVGFRHKGRNCGFNRSSDRGDGRGEEAGIGVAGTEHERDGDGENCDFQSAGGDFYDDNGAGPDVEVAEAMETVAPPSLNHVDRALDELREVVRREAANKDPKISAAVLGVALHGVQQLSGNVMLASASTGEIQQLSALANEVARRVQARQQKDWLERSTSSKSRVEKRVREKNGEKVGDQEVEPP